jgi:hypothetical protein
VSSLHHDIWAIRAIISAIDPVELALQEGKESNSTSENTKCVESHDFSLLKCLDMCYTVEERKFKKEASSGVDGDVDLDN